MSRPLKLMPLALLSLYLLGASGCSLLSDDPRLRSPGAVITDQRLEGRIQRQIRRSETGFKSAHLNIVSYNGIVLLAGQVGTDALRQRAEAIARGNERVREVHNALTVGGPTSFLARSNDSWLTAKVKSRLVAAKTTPGRRIKVVTENGTLYLLGLVPRSEAEAAVAAARRVYGLQRIVKVFEYLDEPVLAASHVP